MTDPDAYLDHAQMTAMARLSKVGISVIDLVQPADPETWVIAFNNPAASEASRTDVQRCRGQRFLEAFPAVRDTPLIALYQQVFDSQRELELPELVFGDEKVPEAAFRVWLTPLPKTAILGQYVNVTEQRQAEEHLRAANAELETRVQQRTAELARARRTLQEVAYAAAHDLSTPVHNLLVLANLLPHAEPADRVDYERQLQELARRARMQLDDLLQYTLPRPEARMDRFSASAVLSEVVAAVEAAPASRVDVAVEVNELRTFEDRFRLIAEQLIANALTYRRKHGPVRVHVAVTRRGEDALLTVQDNGMGIEARHHARIFTAFYRLHHDDEYPGTGMGLALCREAVESCGGTIEVASAPGEGSRFTATFPGAAAG